MEEKETFKIHVEPAQKKPPTPKETGSNQPKAENKDQKRSIKEILKDSTRQIVASAIILIIGFILLNYQALLQIAEFQYRKISGYEGNEQYQKMIEEIENGEVDYSTKELKTSSDPLVQKKQIPDLELEVAPPDSRIIIPRIEQNIPIVRISSASLLRRDWNALEKEMQDALKDGVVHYPGTSLPGQSGNIAITGHSSYFPWDPGRFKDVFALLHEVVEGDKVIVYYEQDKYVYEVKNIQIVLPKDIEVLKQTPEDQLTLITCTPVGTNLKRLIVTAEPVEINGLEVEKKVSR